MSVEEPTAVDVRSAPSAATLLVVGGAVLVVISAFLPWGTEDLFEEESRNAVRVPMQMLWDTTPATFDSFAVGWFVLAGAALMVVGALKSGAHVLALVGSIVSLVMALLWVNGVRAILDDPIYDIDASISDCVGPGTWLCIAGSLVAGVGSALFLRRVRPAR